LHNKIKRKTREKKLAENFAVIFRKQHWIQEEKRSPMKFSNSIQRRIHPDP
jgi:hypothetical protein